MILGFLFLVLLSYITYWRLAKGFTIPTGYRHLVAGVLIFFPALYIATGLLNFFQVHFKFSISISLLWMLYLPLLLTLVVLAEGLTLIYPQRRRWWLLGALAIYGLNILYVLLRVPFYRLTAQIVRSVLIQDTIFFAILLAIFKIVTRTLVLTDKKKGKLILLFCLSIIPDYLDLFPSHSLALIALYVLIYARVAGVLELSQTMRRILWVVLGIGLVIGFPQMTFWGNGLGWDKLYFIGGIWVALMLTAFVVFLLEGAMDWVTTRYRRQRVIGILMVLLVSSGYGVYHALELPVVKEHVVPLKNLPATMSGFTIVQLSDLHLGDLVSPGWFAKTVDHVNGLKPDLIAITGDLIDNGIGDGSLFIDSLKKLKAKYGVWAVTGNHDYYGHRLPIFLRLCQEAGIVVLRNESRVIQTPGGILQVAGMNDIIANSVDRNQAEPDVAVATQHIDKTKPAIMLFHRPQIRPEMAQSGIGLQLSGHTHAGQIPVLAMFAYFMGPYFHGLYPVKDSFIHVSGGTGLYALPMRLFSDNEIVRITLVPRKE